MPISYYSTTYCYLPILPFPAYVPILAILYMSRVPPILQNSSLSPYPPLPIVTYLSYPFLSMSLFITIPHILPYLLLSTYPILSCLSPYSPISLILYMSLYSQIHTNHPHSSIVTYPPIVVFEFAFLVAVKRET